MNHTQAQMSIANKTSMSRFLFWLIALIPTLSFILVPFSAQLSQFVIGAFPPIGESWLIDDLLFFGIPGVVVPCLVAFLITLIFPVVVDRRSALLFAIPVFIIHLYIYSIQPFFDPRIVDPHDFTEDFGFELMWTIVLFFPLGILSLVGTALFSRLGSRIRKGK